ncbi:MAG: ATP-dependent RecD-like DNA helicase [Thermodesulfobacteriota bacterium]|nr:ATP-dependent RecD-like DNA helicase [Thermodesulfobacteriota bacterium]
MTKTTLKGRLERITYTDAESGFTVATLKVFSSRKHVTVVGNFGAARPGEILEVTGAWSTHPQFGEQFRVDAYKTEPPATLEGIRKYLGSGLIQGIGPVMAERITRTFGKDTLKIIETDIDRLREVPGIGKKRLSMIKASWLSRQEIRDVMLFLQGHGVSAGYAVKIYKTYGADTIQIVSENPYRLATDIFGIGFVIADGIAKKLGFTANSPHRVQAGIRYVLDQTTQEGHVYYPGDALLAKSIEILGVERGVVAEAIKAEEAANTIVVESLETATDTGEQENNAAVFLWGYHHAETAIAGNLQRLVNTGKSIRKIDAPKAVQWVQEKLSMTLADKQVEAVKTAADSKVMVITGGPGTGKTTIVQAVLRIFLALGARSLLAAPTGRAAKKLKEATGRDARTIHRMLEFSMAKGGFQRNSDRPLDCDLLVVDEASMIDTLLMYHLLKAVPPHVTFILVGDVNQLPSVGAGNVLNDIIRSGIAPVVALNEIFRQARQSRIITAAHQINQGVVPALHNRDTDSDFYFIEQEDPETVVEVITGLVGERIPRRFGFDPFDDIQVLTPMHKGVAGGTNLNNRLQQALNPASGGLVRGDTTYAVGDKVMQIRNNYDREVFNGDTGRIDRVDNNSREVVIQFDGRPVHYPFADLDEIVLAYAVSVHKSQGSEYPAVVMPMLTQHYILLQRNLIYTAVTRGRQLVVMVGTPRALAIGVNNNKTGRRYTRLRDRLAAYGK